MIERCNLMLEADKDAGAPWGDESIIGSFNEVIVGGAVALHFKAARSTIPSIVNLDQVEAIPFLAMLSLGGEYDGAMWWVRVDAITACRSADADQFNKYKLMKMSWARVDKEKLHTVLFAPRFPGTVGAAADWDALKAHAVELHNAGRAPGLIACGARAAWLNEPVMLYPTLAAIRGANYLTLMSDKEIRSVVTEMEIDVYGILPDVLRIPNFASPLLFRRLARYAIKGGRGRAIHVCKRSDTLRLKVCDSDSSGTVFNLVDTVRANTELGRSQPTGRPRPSGVRESVTDR